MKLLNNTEIKQGQNRTSTFSLFLRSQSLPWGMVAMAVAGIWSPVNYVGLAILVGVFIYQKETTRRDAIEAAKSKAMDVTQAQKLDQLAKDFTELKSQLSLSKLAGSNTWQK